MRAPRLSAPARIIPVAAVAALYLLAAGCSGGPTDPSVTPPTVVITVLSGDGQEIAAGEVFPEPVRVLLTVNGTPASNNFVGFTVNEPQWPRGSMGQERTDGTGVAAIQRRFGTMPGPFSMRVYYSWCSKWGWKNCAGQTLELGSVTVNGTIR